MTELTCIVCPKGCQLYVDEKNDYEVKGNSCGHGSEYGKREVLNPVRVITSTVCTEGTEGRRCPVKTSRAIPKKDIFRAIAVLKDITVQAPVKAGEVIFKDICGTGADWIAVKDIESNNFI